MKKYKACLSVFLTIAFIVSICTFGFQTANAEIEPGIKVPSQSSLTDYKTLHDPFMMLDGKRMTSRLQWPQRRAEISALAQTFEYGIIPGKPEKVTGKMSGGKITVSVTDKGKTVSFDCSIQLPSTGKAPYPAMIGCGMNNLNTSDMLKMGVALITFPNNTVGDQNGVRGVGKFYDLYGKNHSCGSIAAWSWGVSRLIDALEITPDAKIDPKHLGVTGGSRNGKGALGIGAFEERIALTIPQESGSGGSSGWRTADALKAAGQDVQTLSHCRGEQPWFSTALDWFNGKTNKLPYDHHEVLALCAPRGLLVIENTDYLWLGDVSCYNTSKAAMMVYEGLGVANNMGFSEQNGHMHCTLPASQYGDVNAYIKRFLLEDKTANTKIDKKSKNYSFEKSKWCTWDIPALTDEVPWPPYNGTSPSPTSTPTNTKAPTPTPTPTPASVEDVNGDGAINMSDVMIIAPVFNTKKGDPGYNVKYDLNKDGAINMQDVMMIASKFNQVVKG